MKPEPTDLEMREQSAFWKGVAIGIGAGCAIGASVMALIFYLLG